MSSKPLKSSGLIKKTYKGTIHFYYATGELPHFYVWTGDPKAEFHDWDHHVAVNYKDHLTIYSPDGKNDILIKQFPMNLDLLKKELSERGWKALMKAQTEGWEVKVRKNEI